MITRGEFLTRLRDLVLRSREVRTSYLNSHDTAALRRLEAEIDAEEDRLTAQINDYTAAKLWKRIYARRSALKAPAWSQR